MSTNCERARLKLFYVNLTVRLERTDVRPTRTTPGCGDMHSPDLEQVSATNIPQVQKDPHRHHVHGSVGRVWRQIWWGARG